MCVVIVNTQNEIQFIDNVQYYVEYPHAIHVVMDCSNRLINRYKSNMMACYQTQIILIILHVCSLHKLNYITLFHMTCRHPIPALLLLLVRVYDDLLYYYSLMRNTYLCHSQALTYSIQIFIILRCEGIRSYLNFLLIIIYSTNEYTNQVEFYAAMTFYSSSSTLKSLCIFLNVDPRLYWELLLLLYAIFKSLSYFTFPKWLLWECFSRHLEFIILCLISSSKLSNVFNMLILMSQIIEQLPKISHSLRNVKHHNNNLLDSIVHTNNTFNFLNIMCPIYCACYSLKLHQHEKRNILSGIVCVLLKSKFFDHCMFHLADKLADTMHCSIFICTYFIIVFFSNIMTIFNIPVHDYQPVVHIQSKAVIFLTNLLERLNNINPMFYYNVIFDYIAASTSGFDKYVYLLLTNACIIHLCYYFILVWYKVCICMCYMLHILNHFMMHYNLKHNVNVFSKYDIYKLQLISSNLDPLTTNFFAFKNVMHVHTVCPVRQQYNFPFRDIANHDLNVADNTQHQVHNDNILAAHEINEDRIDYSELSNVDPDRNYLTRHSQTMCSYHNDSSFNDAYKNYNNRFSLFHANIRSIPRNLDQLTFYLQNLNIDFSVIALSETWLKPCNKDIYFIPGYVHKSVIRESRMGGGVSLFINRNIKFEVISNLSINLEDVDMLFIEIDKNELKCNKNLMIGVCYRAPHVCANKFIDEMHRLLDDLTKLNKHIYLLGDFNINTMKSHIALNKVASDFSNLLLSHFFHPLVDKPTRVIDDSKSLIDNIYTNLPQFGNICKSGILKTDFSDHYSIFSFSNYDLLAKKDVHVHKRAITEKNKSNFHKALKRQNWDFVFNTDNVEVSFKYFHDKICELFEDNLPLVKVKVTYSNKLPWITHGLRESVKTKRLLHKKMEQNPSSENKSIYKKFRNLLTSLMRRTQRDYLEEQLEIANSAKKWKIMKDLINKTNSSKDSTSELFIDGSISKDSQDIANAYNDYFIEIGPRLANNITSSINPMTYVTANVPNTIFIPHITEHEITTVISSMKHSSPGWDSLPTHILKPFLADYIKPLTYLINKSFETGIFPDELKIAKIVPIFKSGDKTLVSNYRPISVLSFFSKIFETILYNHLIEFIEKHDLLYKFQFGFRKQFSTSHAIISLVDKIHEALNSGNIMIGVTLDFSKAFDTIQISILLKKLYSYGIRGITLKLIESYLTNRQQFVKINNSRSTSKTVTCGVPQGSVLGPLFFLICINDLPNVSDKLFSILFADDTSVFIEGKNIDEVIGIVNTELAKLTVWLAANKLTLNIKKSNFMIFHRARIKWSTITTPLLLNGITLERLSFTKFLGVIIDDKLSFIRHITYIKSKISKGLGILLKARKYLNRKCLLNLYYSFIYPYLTYCVEVWGNTPDTHIDPLIKLQKKVIRIITFSPYLAHTEPLFKELNILPFPKVVIQRIALQMFKFTNKLLPSAISELFISNSAVYKYNTRNKTKLRQCFGKHEYMYRSFKFSAVYIWNALLDSINTHSSYHTFKKTLKLFLLNNTLSYRLN